MPSPSPIQVSQQINVLISYLVKNSLADAQNFAYPQSFSKDIIKVMFQGCEHLSITLKDRNYRDIYKKMSREKVYNAKMIDGALIQMSYEYVNSALRRHRLAFLPSPYLEDFQEDPDIYLDDEIYSDITSRDVTPVPLRFDYDARASSYKELLHPKSHLSLGQYPNCRIPVTSPVTPIRFMDFVLRNFYDTEQRSYSKDLPQNKFFFTESISSAECDVFHIVVPK